MSVFKKLKSSFQPPTLSESIKDIAAYYETAIGRALYSAQKRLLTDALSNLFGYHLMEISALPKANLSKRSRVNHCFRITPNHSHIDTGSDQSMMASDVSMLPLPDESIDVCILHHVLEFSENPHQVLKEASRVTIARGHIIIVGFNPKSLMGLGRVLCRPFKRNTMSRRRALHVHRLQDWLEFLDFSCSGVSYAGHNLPINNRKYLRSTRGFDKFCRKRQWPLGSIYCIVARKDKLSMTPLKPEWNTPTLSGLAKKSAYRSGSQARLRRDSVILPFRKNVNKSR